ncbi:MAG: hypothetical protein AB1705_08685 [Verrucomicrobiota bacterium]
MEGQQIIAKPVAGSSRRKAFRRFLSDLCWSILLGVLAAGIWIAHEDLWSRADWNVPANYEGDGQQILGWIKAAEEGDYNLFSVNFVSRLGAPFEANWNDYPMYEKAFTIVLGFAARIIGLMAASHLGIVLTHMLATMSFFLVCRWFRWDRWWSAAGAVLYGFFYYNSWRGLPHLLLGLTYTIPLAVLSAWLVSASHRLRRYSSAWKLCVGISLLMGLSNPYYLNIYAHFLVLGLALQWFGERRRENLDAGLVCLGACAVGFVAAHSGSLLYRLVAGKNPGALVRTYMESEIYAMRPIELAMPPADHRLGFLADLGQRYSGQTFFASETLSAYLGVVGLAGLACLLVVSFRKLTQQQVSRIPVCFWQVCWVVAYSVIGGINCWIAFCGVNFFRASNRNSMFIAAIALLWGVSFISRRTCGWPVVRKALAAILISLIGLADQLPKSDAVATRKKIAPLIRGDEEFFPKLEALLPRGSMVFQLPVTDFPEGLPVEQMGSYEHLRAFFFTSTLQFSYGSNKGRADCGWQYAVEHMPVRSMIARLEESGFHAVLIHRAGFFDRGKSLLSVLNAMGYTSQIEDDSGKFVAVVLKPRPDRKPLNLVEYPWIAAGDGWRRFRDESPDKTIWMHGAEAKIGLRGGYSPGTKFRLQISLAVPSRRQVTILLDDKVIWQQTIEKDLIHDIDIAFPAPDRHASLHIKTDRPLAAFGNQFGATGTFAVTRLSIAPQQSDQSDPNNPNSR